MDENLNNTDGGLMNCDNCKHYEWYYDKCRKWDCEVDAREVHNCFEQREAPWHTILPILRKAGEMGMIEINMPMPEKCGLCPCFHFVNPMYCQAVKADKNKKIVNPYGSQRPEWCPLKEQTPHKETFWASLSEAELMEPMRHFKD